MYGFLTSKLDSPDYHVDRPDLVPKSYFPNAGQLARVSMSPLDPEVLLRLPLRLLNAMGGIDSLSLLPSFPLLARHFFESFPRTAKGLALKSEDFPAPITLCYDDMLTVIVFRGVLNHDGTEPIVTHWYTCINAFEWWCEFHHSPAVKFYYDVVGPYRPLRYLLQTGQMPPSPLSFFRPYSYRPEPYMNAHSTVWVAMEYLQTLVTARSVTHISITHQETIVRLADSAFPPVQDALFLAVLDWARTQIRLPLLFETMPPSWSACSALSCALPAGDVCDDWVFYRVPMDEYSELCDDEHFQLSDDGFLKRVPVLMEHFFSSLMLTLHSLFSQGNRGLRPRITAHAVQTLQRASDILRNRLWRGNGSPRMPLQRKHIPDLLKVFKDASRQWQRGDS